MTMTITCYYEQKGFVENVFVVTERMTVEERKMIQSTKPHLLKATERELGIGLKSKLTLIIETLDENRATGGYRYPRA
jgi:hypothetical protein